MEGSSSSSSSSCGTEDLESCADGEYCHCEIGSCTGHGICKEKPEVCTMQYDPVCGCDNRIYGNGCGASARGVSVSTNQGSWWMNFFNLSPSPVETTRSNSAASGNRRASIVVVFGLSLALIFGIPEHLQRGTNQVTNKSHTTT